MDPGKCLCRIPVIVRVCLLIKRRQHHKPRPALDDSLAHAVHILIAAALIQVGDKHYHCPVREINQPFAVGKRAADIRSAAELDAHQNFYRVFRISAQIDDACIKDHQLCVKHRLLKTILSMKHLMSGQVLTLAREIVRKVAEEMMKKLEQEVRQSFFGKLNRSMSSPIRSMRNLDMKKTIRRNLKNYDVERGELVLKDIYFSARMKRYNSWRVIICQARAAP